MRILKLLSVAVIAIAVLCGCSETPARNDASSDTASADISLLSSVADESTSSEESDSSEITFTEDYGVDTEELKRCFAEFQPYGEEPIGEVKEILQRGLDAAFFLEADCEISDIPTFIKEDPDVIEMEDYFCYIETGTFDVTVGKKKYTVSSIADLRKVFSDSFTEQYLKIYDVEDEMFGFKTYDDGTHEFSAFLEQKGKLYQCSAQRGNFFYSYIPITEKAVEIENNVRHQDDTASYRVFLVPIIRGIDEGLHRFTNFEWFSLEMILDNGVWKVNRFYQVYGVY